ncbi:hypothetical protein PU629_08910 [Pullulanibacillus sp. KACC 23026]|uniref:hypothetical protein n=1 Tax=Pullulanibacillus sp. KACC 23026 TaxID=3028315 RepID=UPI0023AF5AE4|nr:hypothetical protein [Pullulanibacillus sp. KACC 23026]WEG14456.1 hypothetical protein PU629_08910 [Pullulanibacillus sp. KACC 23026]
MKKIILILTSCLVLLLSFSFLFPTAAMASAGGGSAGGGGSGSGGGSGGSGGAGAQSGQNNQNYGVSRINGIPVDSSSTTILSSSPLGNLLGDILPVFVIAGILYSFFPWLFEFNRKIVVDKEKTNTLDKSFWKDRALKRRIEVCFIKIQKAWSKQEPGLAATFMSKELLNEHNGMIETMKDQGIRNVVSGVSVSQIKAVFVSPNRDCFQVRIKARMIDYRIDVNTKSILSGQKYQRGILEERWQFIKVDGKWVADQIFN